MQRSDSKHTGLKRFLDAQNSCYSNVQKELTRGKKVSHWMWFIFPQIDGLGRSATAKKYAIKSLPEAEAYLQDPLLGKRLIECTRLVMHIENSTAREIFGCRKQKKINKQYPLFRNCPI